MSESQTAEDAAAPAASPMDGVDVTKLIAPISDEHPCGPDLDELGDMEFMNFGAGVEQAFEGSFFKFDRAAMDLPARIAAGEALLSRSRDARVMTSLAKLSIVNRDLLGFVRQIVALARLFETRWETLQPAPFEGDATLRLVGVQTLADLKTSVLPLEHLPLFTHPRFGPILYRAQLVSSGEIPPRVSQDENGDEVEEKHPPVEEIERALGEIDIEQVIGVRDLLRAADAALAVLRDVSIAKAGHRAALSFRDKDAPLQPRLAAMAAWLDRSVAQRDPARAVFEIAADPAQQDGGDAGLAALAPDAAAGPGTAQPVASSQDAAAALAALDAYFARCEPSNPALLLIRQASQLVGKSYLDALRTLAPSFTDAARIALGRIDALALQVERLADFAAIDPTWEESTTDYTTVSRADAVALMGAIIAYFQRSEPSSPAPLLLERAQRMCGKDFLSILRELLPPDALKS